MEWTEWDNSSRCSFPSLHRRVFRVEFFFGWGPNKEPTDDDMKCTAEKERNASGNIFSLQYVPYSFRYLQPATSSLGPYGKKRQYQRTEPITRDTSYIKVGGEKKKEPWKFVEGKTQHLKRCLKGDCCVLLRRRREDTDEPGKQKSCSLCTVRLVHLPLIEIQFGKCSGNRIPCPFKVTIKISHTM